MKVIYFINSDTINLESVDGPGPLLYSVTPYSGQSNIIIMSQLPSRVTSESKP